MLTTPELRDSDSVFPGENWFFYWKTSPSLWESKLLEYSGVSPLFVPIYWGLHCEHPEHYDFAQRVPETDLKRLSEIARSVGKEIIFILFLGPAPFFPNGGIPSFLSRTLCLDQRGVGKAVVDNEGRLNKIFSFSDPRIFQAFRKFVWHLGQYFISAGLNNPIYGARNYYTQNDRFESYLLDTSQAFEQGFSRYVKQVQQNNPEKLQGFEKDPSIELNLKKEFKEMIEELYYEAASESLAANFSGVLEFAYAGGAAQDVFSRSSEIWEHPSNFLPVVFEMLCADYLPNSTLLSERTKKGALSRVLKDLYTDSFVLKNLKNSVYDEDLLMSFLPLSFFHIYIPHNDYFYRKKYLKEMGLFPFFEKKFNWTYRLKKNLLEVEDYEEEPDVHFYFGKDMSKELFLLMLKKFMNGKKVFLDTSELPIEFEKKLDVFILENNLETEKINYLTPITKTGLGEGLLFLYNGKKLSEANPVKKINFWDTLIKYVDLKHLDIEADPEVFYLWKVRLSNAMELDYEEVRRVSFYNPSSYKKKAQIHSKKNFAFLKVVDEIHSHVKSTPVGIEVELLPGGSVSLDYGHFE